MWVMFRSFTRRKSIFRIFPAELGAPEYGQVDFGTLPLKLQDKGRMKAGCYARRGQTEIAPPEVLFAFPVLGNLPSGAVLRIRRLCSQFEKLNIGIHKKVIRVAGERILKE